MTLSPDGKWMWDGSNWIPAPPQEAPEEMIEQPVVVAQSEPTTAPPSGQPSSSISANPMPMENETTNMENGIFKKPATYAIAFTLLLSFAIFAFFEAEKEESTSYDYYALAHATYRGPTDCDNHNVSATQEELCQNWDHQSDYHGDLSDDWRIYSGFSLAFSLICLGYGGYLAYPNFKK